MSVRAKVMSKFLILAIPLLIVCSLIIPVAPVKAVPAPSYMFIHPGYFSIPANGISTTVITVYVEDIDENPIAGITVNLSTDHGTLDNNTPVTNADGEATATLTSEASDTLIIATIKATVSGLRDATAVYFTPTGYPPVYLAGTAWISGTGTVSDEWWGSVDIVATGDHCFTGGIYAGIPAFILPPNNPLIFFDLYLDNTVGVTNVTVTSCLFNLQGGWGQQLQSFRQQVESYKAQYHDFIGDDFWSRLHFYIYYLDGTTWVPISDQYLGPDGCLAFTINANTIPDISQLGGLVFADTFVIEPEETVHNAPAPEKPFNEGDVSPTMTTGAHTFVRNVSVAQSQVAAGEPAAVYANIVNTGDVAGGFTVTLKVNGQVEKTENYVVSAQAAQPVKYVIYRDQPGTYEVDLNGQKTSFSVIGNAVKSNAVSSTQTIIMIVIGVAVVLAVLLFVLLRRRSTS